MMLNTITCVLEDRYEIKPRPGELVYTIDGMKLYLVDDDGDTVLIEPVDGKTIYLEKADYHFGDTAEDEISDEAFMAIIKA